MSDMPPYASPTVPFMWVVEGGIEWSNDRWTKVAMCRGDAEVMCAWPGQYRTDLFVVDKAAALIALGGDDEEHPPLGARFEATDWNGERAIYEIVDCVRGGRPLSISRVMEDGSLSHGGMSFGTAQAWRSWRAEAKPVGVPA